MREYPQRLGLLLSFPFVKINRQRRESARSWRFIAWAEKEVSQESRKKVFKTLLGDIGHI